MGNWRTVHISGTMDDDQAETLRKLLDTGPNYDGPAWEMPYACLSFSRARPGLCGINAWPAGRMNCTGNLAERDYSVEDVRAALEALMPHAPSMLLKVHCGGEYESDEVAATISVGEGLVVTGPPEIATLPKIPEGQVAANFLTNLLRS